MFNSIDSEARFAPWVRDPRRRSFIVRFDFRRLMQIAALLCGASGGGILALAAMIIGVRR